MFLSVRSRAALARGYQEINFLAKLGERLLLARHSNVMNYLLQSANDGTWPWLQRAIDLRTRPSFKPKPAYPSDKNFDGMLAAKNNGPER
jgi:hypothetical protein